MSLRVVRTREARLVSGEVERVLRAGLAEGGRATLLVPSFAQQLEASRQLAALPGLSLGVQVGVPVSWAAGLWEVWGDGRRLVGDAQRSLVVRELLAAAAAEGSSVGQGAGTIRLLSQLAQRALPWVQAAQAPTGARPDVTRAEQEALGLVLRYAERIAELGLIEESELLCSLPAALSGMLALPSRLVLAGVDSLPCAQRELVCGLARQREVTLVLRERNAVADVQGDRLAALLARRCGGDLAQDGASAPGAEAGRTAELASLRERLFMAPVRPVVPTGAVSLLHPAGPLAEAEAVARKVAAMAAAGRRRIVVCAPDATRAWRELAPKLWARGVSCAAVLPVAVSSLEQGRAFKDFVRTVSRLAELAHTWPQAEQSEDGELVNLGDMSWWPPSGLVDFLLSDISGVPASRVYRLDASWRARRLLAPADVLLDLQSAKKTSAEVARATRELLKGHLAACANSLLNARVQEGRTPGADVVLDDHGEALKEFAWPADALARACGEAALSSAMALSASLRELGLSRGPDEEGAHALPALAEALCLLLDDARAVLRPQLACGESRCRVDIMPFAQAARLEPLSADAMLVMGQTSDESALGGKDDALAFLLEAVGAEEAADELARARARFACLASVPREELVLERSLFDASSKERFPSVMLTELLACYGAESEEEAHGLGLAVEGLGELDADANCAPSGLPSAAMGSEGRLPAGVVGEGARPLIVVPNEGRVELLDGRPLLSASQIESYLECPYKWFSLRRLRLRDCDAGFTPMEMGTFAHRVLEVTHRTLLEEARAAAGQDTQLPLSDLMSPLPGSRITPFDAELLAHARKVLADEFDLHLRHQFLRQPKNQRQQLLVPHTEMDRGSLRRLRQDLVSLLDFEAGLFAGFEPRLMEWDFGRGEELVEYAGAYISGTIDRVDVDAHGLAVVIDYKHKSPSGFVDEYALFPKPAEQASPALLPRRVQSLIYGQVVRKACPQLSVRAAVYLGSKGDHAVSGAVSENLVERIFGTHPLSRKALDRVVVPEGEDFGTEGLGLKGRRGMDALLDATEAAIAEKVGELLQGNIEARPLDERACSYCPVMNCDKRRSK